MKKSQLLVIAVDSLKEQVESAKKAEAPCNVSSFDFKMGVLISVEMAEELLKHLPKNPMHRQKRIEEKNKIFSVNEEFFSSINLSGLSWNSDNKHCQDVVELFRPMYSINTISMDVFTMAKNQWIKNISKKSSKQ